MAVAQTQSVVGRAEARQHLARDETYAPRSDWRCGSASCSVAVSDPETGGRSITPPCLRQYPRWVLRLWSPVVAGCTASSYIGTFLNPFIRLRSLAAPLPYLPPVYGLPTFLSASACTPNHLWHLNRTEFYPMAPQRASGTLTWSSV